MDHNPDLDGAVSTWKLFHKKDAPRKMTDVQVRWPAEWALAGQALTTYYASDKWKVDGEFIRYYHEHDSGTVTVWHPRGKFPWLGQARAGSVPIPRAGAVLGRALAVDVQRHDGKKSTARFDKKALLVADPYRRRVWVIEGDEVVAMIEGPGLRVEARGLVG